jgi:hypothetical protein
VKFVVALSMILSASVSFAAGYKGSISFSNSEVRDHYWNSIEMSEVSRKCLMRYRKNHDQFYRSNCIKKNGKRVCLSKYFGDRRYAKRRGQFRSDGQPLTYLGDALKAAGFPASKMNEMENTSCVGMALTCLGEGFNKTGQSATWKKIRRFVSNNGVGGTSLQFALQKLGWKVLYWNPTHPSNLVEKAKQWDAEEKNWASKGYHEYRYITVTRHGRYWFNPVDDARTLVGFENRIPSYLYDVTFWVGTAHTGYHVFPGTNELVIEAHSTRHITSYSNLEFSDFAPMRKGGAPRWTSTQKYRSGLIAVPPRF